MCQALDRWIARAEQARARQAIKECERRLARFQAALGAGADPAVVTQWINEAQRDKGATQKKLDARPAAIRRKESPPDARRIRRITESLRDMAQHIPTVSAE